MWAERTDYSACKLLEQDTRVMEEVEMGADLEISIIIYLIGEMSRIARTLIVKLNCLFVTSLDKTLTSNSPRPPAVAPHSQLVAVYFRIFQV